MPTKKIVMFEEEWKENFYMKMESDHDSAASGLQISSIGLTETLSFGTPFLVIKMQDALGDLINHTYISPDAVYDLYLGESQDNNNKSSFSISVNNMENITIGKTEDIALDLSFINSNWDKMLRDTTSKSWKNKKYSDVVKELADKYEFNTDDIEESGGLQDIIQPNWSDIKFIRWMVKQAINTRGIGGYDFGLTLDNRMIFATLDKLYDKKPSKVVILSTPNNKVDLFFSGFTIKQDYAPMLIQGASGLKYTYFDYATKKYITGTRSITDSDARQMSDWAFIAEEHNTANKSYDGGRDITTADVVASKVSNSANSIQKITITTKGDINTHIGDIVSVVIPSSEFSKTIINEKYSGHWLVGKILHNVDFESKTFQSTITLVRAGINGVDLKGLIKTVTGKKLGK